MSDIKIEKGVPIPETGGRKYPFRDMDVGDSFAVPIGVKPQTVATTASQFGRRNGYKFSVRKTATGHRCWRVA